MCSVLFFWCLLVSCVWIFWSRFVRCVWVVCGGFLILLSCNCRVCWWSVFIRLLVLLICIVFLSVVWLMFFMVVSLFILMFGGVVDVIWFGCRLGWCWSWLIFGWLCKVVWLRLSRFGCVRFMRLCWLMVVLSGFLSVMVWRFVLKICVEFVLMLYEYDCVVCWYFEVFGVKVCFVFDLCVGVVLLYWV